MISNVSIVMIVTEKPVLIRGLQAHSFQKVSEPIVFIESSTVNVNHIIGATVCDNIIYCPVMGFQISDCLCIPQQPFPLDWGQASLLRTHKMNSCRCVGLLSCQSRYHLLRKSCKQIISSTFQICKVAFIYQKLIKFLTRVFTPYIIFT